MLRLFTGNRIEVEKRTVQAMIRIYCRDHGHGADCIPCKELEAYAMQRLERCPFGADKPACKNCAVHCYKPAMREEIRRVMRYSGPRMLRHHPWLAIVYTLQKLVYRSNTTNASNAK